MLYFEGTVEDITEEVAGANALSSTQSESRLRATQAELQATLDALPDLLFEFTLDGVFRAVHSQNDTEMILPAAYILNKRVSSVLPREAADACMTAIQDADKTGRSVGHQYSMVLSRGTQWFELSVVRKHTEPGEEQRFIAIARDITERKISEEAIQRMAFHDSLTGLPNRRLFINRLEAAVVASSRNKEFGALMFLDLDKFKVLNDTYGHDVGDLMLQEVARRLQHNVRAIDTVARLGGDEFVVLIQVLSTDPAEAHRHARMVGQKILSGLNEPCVLRGVLHTCTPSIGITLFNGDGVPHADILKQADTAMYHAKAQGRNTFAFFGSNMPASPVVVAQAAT
jgi:diguanylate cyclase (GGDEF)-like protein/PAS domain S-box-containing protein